MSRTLYLECNAGISGDMTVAMLLQLGADWNQLKKVLDSLPLEGYTVEKSIVKKAGVDCVDFNVVLDEENHDHDMEYLHGNHDHAHDHEHDHDHEHEHDHNHEHDHDHEHTHSHEHHHAHSHRGLAEIMSILDAGEMSQSARDLAKKIFYILASAEGKAHGLPEDKVHFHEVGAVDSIVDIVAVAVCFDQLDIKEVIVPRLCEGSGTIRCQHGILPVPVPAVANIMEQFHLPVEICPIKGEFVTPTGAAIIAATMTTDALPERFDIEKIGMGAGKRNYERPSILRGMFIHDKSVKKDTIYKLESNIDDCSGEVLGYVMEQLFRAGARDVHYIPLYMKKNRPGWELNVICTKDNVEAMEQIIFTETTTIGIRKQKMERSVLPREIKEIDTTYGTTKVKVCVLQGTKQYYPEYECVAAIAKEKGIPFLTVYQSIIEQCQDK